MNISKKPEWFINHFLEFYKLLNSSRTPLFLKARSAFLKLNLPGSTIRSGCVLIESLDTLIIIGEKAELGKENETIKFTYTLNEQEKTNLLKRRSHNGN